MEDEQLASFNFWPAFADLLLSLILILLLVIGGVHFSSIDIRSIQDKQKKVAETLVTPGRTSTKVDGGIEVRDKGGRLLYRLTEDPHDPMLQIITFSDSLLFKSGQHDLKKPDGEEALREVGRVLFARLGDIVEIQIRGHADTAPLQGLTKKLYGDNLGLASARANEVFRFLQDEVGIAPSEHLMSASSFGEFSPVERRRDMPFGDGDLKKSNVTDPLKQANRRIELLLFYRRPGTGSGPAGGAGSPR